jgi:hypothetical protein
MRQTGRKVLGRRRVVMPVERQMYYYIYAANYKGKPFFDGPLENCYSIEEARKIGFRKLKGVVWEVIESQSRDPSRVQGHKRHDKLMDTGDPDFALERMGHKI